MRKTSFAVGLVLAVFLSSSALAQTGLAPFGPGSLAPIAVDSFTPLLSGSAATFTTPANARQLFVIFCGGASGGRGGDNGGSGSAGTATSFAGYTAAFGPVASVAGTTPVPSGNGSDGTGWTIIKRSQGGVGTSGIGTVIATTSSAGGNGGNSLYGAGGAGGWLTGASLAAAANSCAGGAGGGQTNTNTSNSGSGGNAGETVIMMINSPAASYPYTIGAAGAGGAGGTNGFAGAAGGTGWALVQAKF